MRAAALGIVLALAGCSLVQQEQWNDIACRAQAAANAFTDTQKPGSEPAQLSSIASAVFGSQCVPLAMLAPEKP